MSFTLNRAQKLLTEIYDIQGKLTQLAGYEDSNFLVKSTIGEKYILKISAPETDLESLDFQEKLLQHLDKTSLGLKIPRIIKTAKGLNSEEVQDKSGNTRSVRLLSYIEGRLWSEVNPKSEALRKSLGKLSGKLTSALNNFKHPYAERFFDWDIVQSLWTKDYLHLFEHERRNILEYFHARFESDVNLYKTLRKSIVHNDINDNNIIVSEDLLNPKVVSIIDFGDAIYTHTINDLAISCAYAIMDFNDPLEAAIAVVKGYNETFPLKSEELYHLYNLIAMRLVTSVTQSAINKTKEPENAYLQISEKPAWDLLEKWRTISSDFAHYSFRNACGFTAHPNEAKFNIWAKKQSFKFSDVIPSCKGEEVYNLDLSIGSTWTGHEEEMEDLELFQFKIKRLQSNFKTKIIAGGYCEPRAIYSSEAYDKIGNLGRESRTIHMGVDFWLPACTPIHAIYDGEVITAVDDKGNKEYGGLLILKHKVEDFKFYSLYAHNTPESVLQHSIGDKIKKGEKISELGNYPENGNWAPHLHFQIMLSMLDYVVDFPGVVYPNQLSVFKSIIPDPNVLFKNTGLHQTEEALDSSIINFRKEHLGKSLSLQYEEPLKIVRGAGVYLLDQNGKKYLDTVNNVAHVGHENYHVVKAGQNQMSLLNTNTRYLHKNIKELAEELLETLPPELSVLHFVNSGSEANELALRMARTATDTNTVIASEVGYHGNTNACVEISSYKFNGEGGKGAPAYTHIFPLPDSFRGKYRGSNSGEKYAEEVQKQIKLIHSKNEKVGAFIVEPIISCGGQIELPEGFLKRAYQLVRDAGGLCISDEVQTGCGRMGSTFWGFQLYDVTPDIVTIGKPLGNGHPVAAVACTKKVADAFANGMEYFNTFGGNPVSCAIATEVLRTVKREKLQENALKVGTYLKSALRSLQKEFNIIGHVRGQGLFIGIEFVDKELKPLPRQTNYLVNRMKEHGILMSIDGVDNNVLKIKPPLVFSKENAEELIYYLEKILNEDFMAISAS